MKKVLIVIILLIITSPIFAQVDAKTLADAIFNVTGNAISESEANAITELVNANIISGGKINKIGNKLYLSATITDSKTDTILSSTQIPITPNDNIFSLLYTFCAKLIESLSLKIGDIGPGGGTIFHIEDNKYFEVSELPRKANWKNANKLAEDYRGGSYDDWYLPNKEELNYIYENLRKKGFKSGNSIYWSSSESNDKDLAWRLRFRDGGQGNYFKSSIYNVCAVRAF